ncbi:MAG: hydrogenase [Desulfuromonas sp.]|nr:MAG: hydrogenase [Desulfuromonas sp.]
MQDYTDTILKYASDNTRTGFLEHADGTGEVGLSAQEIGSRLAVRFTLNQSNDQVDTIRYQVFGCGFTIAACAAAAELAEGLPLTDAHSIDAWAISNRLNGLPQERSYCAKLACDALQAALASAQNHAEPVVASRSVSHEETGARVNPENPLYIHLMGSAGMSDEEEADRRMFAGLLTVASHETGPLHGAVGLDEDSLVALLELYFPGFDLSLLPADTPDGGSHLPDINQDILRILLAHVPCDATGGMNQPAEWLARIIAARTARPGHLWVSMGFLERAQLSAAIRRHLPTLAAANSGGMRWKRYLFKQVCEMNGGVMCKSPNCGDCSDYAFCFSE